MRSDERVAAAVLAAEPGIRAFQAAVASAAERLDTLLDAVGEDPVHERTAVELGDFAAGRIDVARFAALAGARQPHDDHELALLRRCRDVLREQAAMPTSRFVIDVPPGGRINSALGHTFAELGIAFGAVLVAELVRTRRYDPAEHAHLLHALPRHQWNRAERASAPPLVVSVDGADLWAGELAQYLDGAQKIILVVRAPMAPAPLVRLITPGTWVQQTASTAGLATVLATSGPAVVAIVPEGAAAEFVHVPDARVALHERLAISARPTAARKALQSWSAWQQTEELAQLQALAVRPAVVLAPTPAAATPVPAVPDPADQLARWLLSHADLASARA